MTDIDTEEWIIENGAMVHYRCGKVVIEWSGSDPVELQDLIASAKNHECLDG